MKIISLKDLLIRYLQLDIYIIYIMKKITFLLLAAAMLASCSTTNTSHADKSISSSKKEYKAHTVAFYNVENLFDLEDDPNTVFHDRTPRGEKFYTEEVYKLKQKNLAKVIADIGSDFTGTTPTIVGLAEIENYNVLNDLVNQDALKDSEYSIVHYDSPDLRGIDVGLLYKKNAFTVTNSVSHRLKIFDARDSSRKLHTRDQLVVSGLLDGEKIHFIVHHWPSRSGGEARSLPNRIKAGEMNRQIVDSLLSIDPNAKIINMGDFNDDPVSPSVKEGLVTKESIDNLGESDMYNPMEAMFNRGVGSLAWRDSWNLFDQIMVSKNLVDKDYSSIRFYQAGVFNKPYLATPQGRFKGYPYRSYSNEGWTGGYSDHFPVYIYLIKEK